MDDRQRTLETGPAPGSLRCLWELGPDGRPRARWEPAGERDEIVIPDFVPAFLLAG